MEQTQARQVFESRRRCTFHLVVAHNQSGISGNKGRGSSVDNKWTSKV